MTRPVTGMSAPGVVASFWRRDAHADGFFASIQNPFFESGKSPPPAPPAPPAPECAKNPNACEVTWVGHTWRTFNPPASWRVTGAEMAVDLHFEKQQADHFDEAVLATALPGGFGTVGVSVSFPGTPASNYGCAGLLIGADVSFGPGANDFVGWEVSLSPASHGQESYVVLVYHNHDSNQLVKKTFNSSSAVPMHQAVPLSVDVARPGAGQSGVIFTISVANAQTIVYKDDRGLLPGPAVAVRAYEIDASFSDFSVKPTGTPVERYLDRFRGVAVPPRSSPEPLLLRYTAGIDHDANSSGPYLEVDYGVIGLTELSAYVLPESGTNLGEARAFKACVEFFLLDREMREAKALRYNAAWDCNEYQLDVSQPADVAEYKRIIDRNAQIGIPNQVYEPRNTAVSSRFNHTDDWEWEMVLMFEMNGDFRRGTWTPGKDALPPTVATMMEYFKTKGVRPTAYFYPILNFQTPGSDDDKDWLYPYPGVSGQRSTLASANLQDYLIGSLSAFMNQTGAIGFAWDYTFFSDTNHSIYSQWKGWQRVTNTLRRKHPDMVCDNRQNAHKFGPWYQLAGSYAEPIAGDENPESYGAALASLSTDHVLANNLRLVNYVYRQQLLPNNRIPGFIFHQPERQFDNNTGTDPGHMQVWTRWHVRDFGEVDLLCAACCYATL